MFQLSYHKDINLFYIRSNKEIHLRELITVLKHICTKSNSNDQLLLITDHRDNRIKKNEVEAIDDLATFINEKLKNQFKHIKWASIASDYMTTTVSYLLKEEIKGNNINYEPFTTIEKVYSWMNISQSHLEFLKIISYK